MNTKLALIPLCIVLWSGSAAADETAVNAEQQLLAALDQKVARTNSLREKEKTVEPATLDRSGLLRLAGLAVVVAVMAFAAALLVKKGREHQWLGTQGDDLAVKESVWIGKGQRLLLVGVQGQSILVGATPQGLYGLGSFERSTPAVEAPLPVDAADRDAEFNAMLKEELTRGARGSREDRRRILHRLHTL
jgi:flagellar biogenesis protein FliO